MDAGWREQATAAKVDWSVVVQADAAAIDIAVGIGEASATASVVPGAVVAVVLSIVAFVVVVVLVLVYLSIRIVQQYERMIALGLGELDKSGIAELTFKGRRA